MGKGLGNDCEKPGTPALLNARLWQGKANKVKFGKRMTAPARLLSPSAAFVPAAPKYLCLNAASGKQRAARTVPIFSVAASGNG